MAEQRSPTLEDVIKMGQERAAREEQANQARAARAQRGPLVALGIGLAATFLGGAAAFLKRRKSAERGET